MDVKKEILNYFGDTMMISTDVIELTKFCNELIIRSRAIQERKEKGIDCPNCIDGELYVSLRSLSTGKPLVKKCNSCDYIEKP